MTSKFTFFESYQDAIDDLTDEQQLAMYKAISKLSLYGEEPELDGICATLFKLIRPTIECSKRKQEAGLKGSQKKQNKVAKKNNLASLEKKSSDKEKERDKEEDKDKDKEEEGDSKGGRRFTPPTLAQVKDYVSKQNYEVDSQHWYDHYQSNGWMVGRTKMKDWQAAVRTWHKKRYDYGGSKGNGKSFEDVM